MQRITSDEFQRTWRRYLDQRPDTPLIITCDGEDRLVVISCEEYERLRRRDPRVIAVEDLSDAEIEALRSSKAPAEAAQYNHEWPTERSTDT